MKYDGDPQQLWRERNIKPAYLWSRPIRTFYIIVPRGWSTQPPAAEWCGRCPQGERACVTSKRTNGSEYVFISFFPSSETSADSLSQSKEDQAGALGAADHLGDADFLFLEQVGGTFPDVRDAEPDAVLAEVRNAGKESDEASCKKKEAKTTV